MECKEELLQAYLDDELDPAAARELKLHLAECCRCRRELSQLKLLWHELSASEQVDVPPAVPYLRQQAIAQVASGNVPVTGKFSFWETQKLAWSPLGRSLEFIPGTNQVMRLTRTAFYELPHLLKIAANGYIRRHSGQPRGRQR